MLTAEPAVIGARWFRRVRLLCSEMENTSMKLEAWASTPNTSLQISMYAHVYAMCYICMAAVQYLFKRIKTCQNESSIYHM